MVTVATRTETTLNPGDRDSFSFFSISSNSTPTKITLLSTTSVLSMMELFSRRAEIDLARCWAPGLERSFRSFWINWESAVVTDSYRNDELWRSYLIVSANYTRLRVTPIDQPQE